LDRGAASRRLVNVTKFSDLENVYIGDFLSLDPDFKIHLEEDLPEVDARKLQTALDRVKRDSFDKNLIQLQGKIREAIPVDENERREFFKDLGFRERVVQFLVRDAMDQAGAILTYAGSQVSATNIPIIRANSAELEFVNVYGESEVSTPQVTGIAEDIKKYDTQIILINFETGSIYEDKEDKLEIKKREVKVEDVVKVVKHPVEPAQMEDVLVRARDIYEEFRVHPLVLVQRGHEEEFKNGVRGAIRYAAERALKEDKLLVYQTSDLDSKEYRDFRGGKAFTLEEKDPKLGLTGLYRFVRQEEEGENAEDEDAQEDETFTFGRTGYNQFDDIIEKIEGFESLHGFFNSVIPKYFQGGALPENTY